MKSLLKYIIRKYFKHLSIIVFIGLSGIIASLGFVVLSKRLIDTAIEGKTNEFYYYAVIVVLVIGLQILLSLLSTYVVNCTTTAIGNRLRYNVYYHILYSKWSGIKDIHSADVLTRVMRDIDDIVTVFVSSVPNSTLAIIQFIITVVALFYLNPLLAILIAVGTPVLALAGKFYFVKMKKITDDLKKTDSIITEHIQETITKQIVIKAFERQTNELSKLSSYHNKIYELSRKRTLFSLYNNGMFNIAFNGGYIGTFIWGGILLIKKAISFGTMTAYLQLVIRIQKPIQSMISILPNLVYAKSSFERLSKLFDIERESYARYILKSNKVDLKISNISFKYEDGNNFIYDNFSMNLHSGDIVAYMGKTGSGKTTLVRLLLGLISPTKGNIILSNENESFPVSEKTRGNFVYVPQGGSLLTGTIKENLLVGDVTAKEHQLKRALKMACADFVFDLPGGLEYRITENHTSISEGQAQRIAIARSLLRPGKIILLDEATSALDENTELDIFNNLKKYYQDRIVIFITHHSRIANLCSKRIQL